MRLHVGMNGLKFFEIRGIAKHPSRRRNERALLLGVKTNIRGFNDQQGS
jgi:hypothetical protein